MAKVRNDMRFETPIINHLNFSLRKNYDNEAVLESEDIHVRVENQVLQNDKTNEKIPNTCKTIVKVNIGDDSEGFPFFINLEMEAVFHWDEDIDIDIDSYIAYQTPAIIYSYMRPIISDTVSKAGFPPFNLPFMNFMDQNVEIDEIDNN